MCHFCTFITLVKRYARLCLPPDYFSFSVLLAHVSLCVVTPLLSANPSRYRTQYFITYHSLLMFLSTALIAGLFYLMASQTQAHLPVFQYSSP